MSMIWLVDLVMSDCSKIYSSSVELLQGILCTPSTGLVRRLALISVSGGKPEFHTGVAKR